MSSVPRRLAVFVMLAATLATSLAAPLRAEEVLRDAETEALFNDVARPLIIAAGLTPASVQIVLVSSPEINAFAGGGQNVFIYSGLIENADNVNWLQGVIAHELGHIAGGHNVRSGEAIGRANHISILSLIAAVGLAAAGAPEAGLAALGFGMASAEAGVLAYSRDQESSADLAGASYLARTGVSGRGSIGFFNKLLGLEYRAGVPQTNSYGRTHPLDGERIAILDGVYKASPAWNTPPTPPSTRASSGSRRSWSASSRIRRGPSSSIRRRRRASRRATPMPTPITSRRTTRQRCTRSTPS